MTISTQKNRVGADEFTISRATTSPMVAAINTPEVITAKVVAADGTAAPAGTDVTWTTTAGNEDALSATTSKTDALGIAKVTVTSAYEGIVPVKASVGSSYKLAAARYQSGNVTAPYVLGSLDGDIDEYDLKNDIVVKVPKYNNEAIGDSIIFYWDNVHHTSIDITAKNLNSVISINITQTFPPACLIDGKYQLFYEHIDSNQNIAVSKPCAVTVTGGTLPASLPEPTFPEATTGTININKARSDGGTPIDMTYLKMTAGDILHVVWEGYSESNINLPDSNYEVDHVVTADEVTAKLASEVIPTANIMAIPTGSAQAYYKLTPVSGGDTATSVVAEVNVDTQA
ncbi:Ig-like domain-containing protein [Ewingella americana]|uniref:Big-1 domain-containing protein n=1 Tax=Ewingella americana TaxID=41202 RepID=A0A502GUW8_9GAMM|nr:Ig-like domain-containing protein [Ewingella americana]TPG65020.1 hypothetical protein EAH77_01900 [Ewingella americana]